MDEIDGIDDLDMELDVDFDDGADDDLMENLQQQQHQMKEEVAMLKKADAPLSLLFAAFEKQMACDEAVDATTDSENENTPKVVDGQSQISQTPGSVAVEEE